MMDSLSAERIRREIGPEANPLYVENVLKGNNRELLEWLLNQAIALANQTVPESLTYVEIEARRDTLEVGTRIVAVHLRTMLFIVEELRTRLNAISN